MKKTLGVLCALGLLAALAGAGCPHHVLRGTVWGG